MNRAKNLLVILTGQNISPCITVFFILGEKKSVYLTLSEIETFQESISSAQMNLLDKI